MSRRRILVIVALVVAAVGLWLGGRVLWDALVAMHHPRHHG
jgi:hypothetical protein